MANDGSSSLNQLFGKLSIIALALIFGLSANQSVLAAETTTFNGLDYELKLPWLNKEDQSLSIKPKIRNVINSLKRSVSAYNVGDIYQCDGDPCTSANGENICLALSLGYKRCAANFVPFGTILHIENYGECMVTDRMNSRYPNSVDIAMSYEQKKEALTFGRQTLIVSVVKYE